MANQKLKEIRNLKGYTQKQMAEKVAMEQTTYSRKESGKSPISEAEWSRFAKILSVTVDAIKEETESLFKNKNHAFNTSIQYINIPQNIFDIVIKYNQKLEEENKLLKEKLAD